MAAAGVLPNTRRLADLLADVPDARLLQGDAETPVRGVSNDTRRLEPGDVFVAIPGLTRNGLDLVPEALRRGASAIVAEQVPPDLDITVPLVVAPSARAALADLSAAFYGHPSRHLPVIGVTGTDGKTSTTHLVSAILEARGLQTGWLTTVNTKIGDELRANAADHTTPEAPLVQRTLAEMVAAGLDVGVLETSSHALELERVRGTRYQVGVFTNLSPEHINFHGSFEAYRAAKSRMFQMLEPAGLAVLNADDPSSAAMRAATSAPVLTYSLEPDSGADLVATDVALSPEGTSFTLHTGGQAFPLRTHLVGRFNVANWLAAYGVATYFGATVDDLRRAVERQQPVPGRMNLVRGGQPFAVVVDFAHTPQALGKALDTVRSLVPGRVFLAFGLAGGRDFHNRPVMGRLAATKADFVAISMDDPYDEDPREIARQIAAGAVETGAREGAHFVVEVDRRVAIGTVLAKAARGDAVLLAGKGHEQRMMVRGAKLPWNDAEVALQELCALGY